MRRERFRCASSNRGRAPPVALHQRPGDGIDQAAEPHDHARERVVDLLGRLRPVAKSVKKATAWGRCRAIGEDARDPVACREAVRLADFDGGADEQRVELPPPAARASCAASSSRARQSGPRLALSSRLPAKLGRAANA